MGNFDWYAFLQQWSEEWLQDSRFRAAAPAEVLASGWLGYPGATDAQIAAAEMRLGGVALPPSYRGFLRESNGWRNTSTFIRRVWSTEEIDWLAARNPHLVEIWTTTDTPDSWEKRALPACLQISDWGQSALYLLSPTGIGTDGEWEAAFFANWHPGAEVYRSFQALMEAEYASFCELRNLRDLGNLPARPQTWTLDQPDDG